MPRVTLVLAVAALLLAPAAVRADGVEMEFVYTGEYGALVAGGIDGAEGSEYRAQMDLELQAGLEPTEEVEMIEANKMSVSTMRSNSATSEENR